MREPPHRLTLPQHPRQPIGPAVAQVNPDLSSKPGRAIGRALFPSAEGPGAARAADFPPEGRRPILRRCEPW